MKRADRTVAGSDYPPAGDIEAADGAGAAQGAAGIDGHGRHQRPGYVENPAVDQRGTSIGVCTRERQRPAADLVQPSARRAGGALDSGGTAIADDAADRRTEVVAADGEQVRAEIIIASTGDRSGADIAVPGRPARVGEIDDASGIGDEARAAAAAVVVELREASIVRGDARAAGGAVVVE